MVTTFLHSPPTLAFYKTQFWDLPALFYFTPNRAHLRFTREPSCALLFFSRRMRASREVSGHELEDDQNDLLTLECSSFLPKGRSCALHTCGWNCAHERRLWCAQCYRLEAWLSPQLLPTSAKRKRNWNSEHWFACLNLLGVPPSYLGKPKIPWEMKDNQNHTKRTSLDTPQ